MEPQPTWQEDCAKIATWAESIGLKTKKVTDKDIRSLSLYPFLPNMWILKGIAYYDDWTHPGSLLHDLGHLAVSPSWLRPLLSGDTCWEQSSELVKLVKNMCDPEAKGSKLQNWNTLIHGDEQAAIAWSFTAAQAADVDDFLPFEIGFDNLGGSTGEELHESLSMSASTNKCYNAGITCLFHSGMLSNKSDFPKLNKWLQD